MLGPCITCHLLSYVLWAFFTYSECPLTFTCLHSCATILTTSVAKGKKKPLLVFTSHFLPSSPNSNNCTWMFFLCRLAVWDFVYKYVHVVWFVWLLWFSMMLSSFIHVEACVHTYSLPCLLIHCTDMSPLSTHALVVILLVFLFCLWWIMLPEHLCTSRREFSFSFLVVFISECNYWVIW